MLLFNFQLIPKHYTMKNKINLKWLPLPEEHDYMAAMSYLSLIYEVAQAKQFVEKLEKAIVVEFKSKDIFRASSLSLLGISNKRVKRDLKKIEKGISLSPILLVRDSINGKVVIADGYHRLCAVYALDEDLMIACKIV